eukprot:1137916-Pelagomonas_calceolata.AAC.1
MDDPAPVWRFVVKYSFFLVVHCPYLASWSDVFRRNTSEKYGNHFGLSLFTSTVILLTTHLAWSFAHVCKLAYGYNGENT